MIENSSAQIRPSNRSPQTTISAKLFVAFGFISITAFFAGAISIVALTRTQSNFDKLINKNLPTLMSTAHISQLAASVADKGPTLIVSPNEWIRQTIISEVDDDAKWLEEILTNIPESQLPRDRKKELLGLQVTLVDTYRKLSKLTEKSIQYGLRLKEIDDRILQAQKDLVDIELNTDFPAGKGPNSYYIRNGYKAIHDILLVLVKSKGINHPVPLRKAERIIYQKVQKLKGQIQNFQSSSQFDLQTTFTHIQNVSVGPNGLFAIKLQKLAVTAQVKAALKNARTIAEQFLSASALAAKNIERYIGKENQRSTLAMDVTLQTMVAFISISILISFFTFLYVRRTVLRRLNLLRRAMLAHAEGENEIIDTKGNDEITDMAQSLQYLVDALNSREVGLREAKDEAEHASIAKTRFLAAASHDLRQPLQALNLFVYALESQEQDASKREVITLIRNSLDSLKELLNTLLDISKLEAGVVQANFKDFEASQVIAHIKDEMTAVAWANDLELRMVPNHSLIHSDPFLLGTVIRNFLDNAIKYTSKGKVLIGCRHRGTNLRFEIWDTGAGIAADQCDLIFQDFYQVDNEARKRAQGLGLGLSIVKRMSELLNSHIGCSSILGKGSVFWVDVPLSAKQTEKFMEQDTKLSSIPFVKNGHIVIFDDDESILLGLKALLENQGYTSAGFQSINRKHIANVLQQGSQQPDLIIADYRLEAGATGREAISVVRELLGKNIPAIIITGDTEPERLREAKQSGFPILHKPVRPEDLLIKINNTLAK